MLEGYRVVEYGDQLAGAGSKEIPETGTLSFAKKLCGEETVLW